MRTVKALNNRIVTGLGLGCTLAMTALFYYSLNFPQKTQLANFLVLMISAIVTMVSTNPAPGPRTYSEHLDRILARLRDLEA